MDFYKIRTKETKGIVQAYPDWIVDNFEDLMVRGGSFYAVWDEGKELWSTDEFDIQRSVDRDLLQFVETIRRNGGGEVQPLVTRNFSTGSWEKFNRFVRNLPSEGNFHPLDENLTFRNTVTTKQSYASKRLPYSLEEGKTDAWDELVGVLYSPSERDKIEWAIGAIISGDSKWLQKFIVFYGPPASGKSTVIGIIERLFVGYVGTFEAKTLTSNSATFAMEMFQNNPLVAIQHDGDLSRIEDNTKLNSIVGHDSMTINVKYRSAFTIRPNAFLILGTNKPVKITDAKAGNTRRLIDIHPTGAKIETGRYHILYENVNYELGAIAHKCLRRYREMGKFYYENYIPTRMMMLTDHFYNFVEAHFDIFKAAEGIQLKRIWELYKQYCEEANIIKRLQYHEVRDELSSYFEEFKDRFFMGDKEYRSVYIGFKGLPEQGPAPFVPDSSYVIELVDYDPPTHDSVFNHTYSHAMAQGANSEGLPTQKWENVTTRLRDLDVTQVHYVRVPREHIVVDFDLTDSLGEKDLARNLEEASKLPPTYAELSKSGNGIHLHYIYGGDVADLASSLSPGIEIKTLLGNSSLRRKLTKCNNLDISVLSGGLPRKEKPVRSVKAIQTEKGLRAIIERNLRKEIHPGTKPSVDFIHHILEEAYLDGNFAYNLLDMRSDILAFAARSSHHAGDCIKLVQDMKFVSQEEMEDTILKEDSPIVFFDIEVYPNLLVVCWKFQNADTVVRMINPTPEEIEPLFSMKLVGFNNRRYDNHILYARYLGYTNEEIYAVSEKIINGGTSNAGMFGEAYGLSYADILEFSSKKQSLKKFQIDLGIHHMELDLPWDQPVDEGMWGKVEEYCVNDVLSTEAVFDDREQDFIARKILAELSGLSMNHITQQHTARIIFGEDKNPEKSFVYTDLSEMFPGYRFDGKQSTYCEEVTGEGGYVYSEPGYYEDVADLDIVSMHPTSIIELDLFGKYTEKFAALKDIRVAIKRKEYDKARSMMDGRLEPFLIDAERYPVKAEDLAYALKIIINIVYGLTSAHFPNPFRDKRNRDNIVAKRGALFMIDLKHAVQDRGFTVAHIKTDSIKIPNATPEIIQFVMDFGREYGYEFELDKVYQKLCLVNDAVYIGVSNLEWTAIGAQFQHPYVFKSLFTHEEIVLDDLCETRSVKQGKMYLDMGLGDDTPIELMRYVGSTGSFMPVEEYGGRLWRIKDGRKYAVSGTKGYLWVEREIAVYRDSIGELNADVHYFEKLVGDARKAIEEFVSYEEFVS